MSAATAIAARESRTSTCGTGRSSRRSATTRNGTALDRLGREVVAVRALARDGEEQGAGHHGTGVVGEIQDLDRWASEHLHRLERRDEALQIHLGRECTGEGSAYLSRRFGGTSRYWRSKEAICSNAGAATVPP